MPSAVAQYAESYPRELLAYEHSICRVNVQEGYYSSHGSGVLIQPPESHAASKFDYVLTCYHVIADRTVDSSNDSVTVTWDGETDFVATVAAARPGCDTALLAIPKGQVPTRLPRVRIATTPVTLGELAFAFGFGDTENNRLRCTGGPVTAFTYNIYHDPVWLDIAGQTRKGDSGGPVFVVREDSSGTKQVYIIGQAFGACYDKTVGHYTLSASRLRVLRRLFGQEQAKTNPHPGGGVQLVGVGAPPRNPQYSQPVTPRLISGGS